MTGIGVVVGGWATVRFSRRAVTIWSEVGAGICFVAFSFISGPAFLAVLYIGLFLAYLVFPLHIIMAQEASPRTKGATAGIVMGLAYGNAALVVFVLNKIGDRIAAQTGDKMIGMSRQFQIAAVGFMLAVVIAFFMRFHHNTRTAPEPSEHR